MLIENDTEGETPDMTVTLTTCTTFINTGPPVVNPHSVLKHLSLPPGITGWHNLLLKATATFPSKNVVSTGQVTTTADHLILRPVENRLDKHPQNPWEAINGCETGMPLMTSWPKDGYYTMNKRFIDHTIHGILDPWCQQYYYYIVLCS